MKNRLFVFFINLQMMKNGVLIFLNRHRKVFDGSHIYSLYPTFPERHFQKDIYKTIDVPVIAATSCVLIYLNPLLNLPARFSRVILNAFIVVIAFMLFLYVVYNYFLTIQILCYLLQIDGDFQNLTVKIYYRFH